MSEMKTLKFPGDAEPREIVDAKARDDISKLYEEIANLGGGTGGCYLTVETITIGEGTGETVAVTGIALDYSTISLNEGETMMLAASVAPSDATNRTVLWKSSDTSVATVDNGLVTAVSSGNATITAYSQENSSIEATCAVTVAAESGGGGSADTSKIQLATLNIVDGYCINNSGNVVAINNTAHYVEIPYSDGMFVSTGMNKNWVNGYPPFMVFDNGTYTKPDYVMGDLLQMGDALPYQYSATLTGFSNGASVFVNMYYPAGQDIAAYDAYYYIPGGAE